MRYMFNSYVAVVEETEDDARAYIRAQLRDDPGKLIHVEKGEDPEELPTWVFLFLAFSQSDVDCLHDLYDLPNFPNLPIKVL